MERRIFELTIPGFNGGTDETDHHVLWVVSPDLESVLNLATPHGVAVQELPVGHVDDDDDIDYNLETLSEQSALITRILKLKGH